jgi:hypothetical protein
MRAESEGTERTDTDADRILSGLDALLTPGEVTERDFRRILSDFPELLSEHAQVIGEALANLQEQDAAKTSVLRVMHLIKRCVTDGVDEALFQVRLEANRQKRDDRLAELQRKMAEQRKALMPQGTPKKTSLPSLAECAQFLRSEYSEETVATQAKSVERPWDNERSEIRVPRFFFRGEPGKYPTTTSSVNRIWTRTDLPLAAIEDILRCKISIQAQLVQRWKMSPMLAEGFLQHYGMPTNYLDFTSKLNVAISFASDLQVGDVGQICVMPFDRLENNGQLIDLSRHPFAERPARQCAFAWASDKYRDLQNPDAVTALGLNWYAFEFTEQDKREFGPDPVLLDAHSDRAAGAIELAMHGVAKIHNAAARWVADHLQPAPFMLIRAPGNDREGRNFVWVSAEDAGLPYEERDSRQVNYERWSKDFPASETKPLPEGLGSTAADIPIGGIVRVVTSDLFGILGSPFGHFSKLDHQDSVPKSE